MGEKKKEQAVVLSQEKIAEGIYSLWIKTNMAENAKPGQFISIYTKSDSRLLPRPISICEIKKDALRIVYRIAGKGTEEFASYRTGDEIDILGPLGNGFPINAEPAFLIGGGIGIPPMLALAKELQCEKNIVLGYRDELFLNEELAEYGNVTIATEDGSAGTKGNVFDAVRENGLSAKVIYACGPTPMLRAVKAYALEHDIEAWVSMEERMACGIGACLGCVCRTKEKDEHSQVNNKRICKEGPVFSVREVEL
ncbi:MAG TPA: dihydroorotate dehydrogenase electron transfer subunit [Lachnospiraceae bacterium]|nr:dihydroorotate dehydrogenase electron transfer subunit [Lachnospiraceae bacterium]